MTSRVVLWVVAMLLLAACASKDQTQSPQAPAAMRPPEAPQIIKPEVPPQQRAQLHTDLAAGYYERGQMGVALEELGEAIKLDPNYGRAYNVYGLVYAVLGEDAKSEQSFQKALALAPQDSEIRHNWGWYLCTHGKPRESIAEFEAALKNPLYRTPEVALVNAARCSAVVGDVKGAESYYKRALAVAPTDQNTLFGLASLAYKNARYAEARNFMKAALARPNPPAEMLYLGMCIERNLGDRQAELSFVSQLRNRYPDAPETRAIASGSCE